LLYNPSPITLFPDLQVYSETENTSTVYFRIPQEDLLFNQANEENRLQSQIKIAYNLFEASEKLMPVDSSIINKSIEKDPSVEFHYIEFTIAAKKGKSYFLEVIIEDQNRKSNRTYFRSVNRTKDYNQQDFKITNPLSGELSFDPYIRTNKAFSIKHYNQKFDSLQVLFYKKDFSIPLAPSRTENLTDSFNTPDTIFICYIDSIDFTNFEKEGIYYFSPSNYSDNGFSLFNFGPSFPNVVNPCELIEPLGYLASINNCSNDTTNGRQTKLAVDNFWLSRAKNINRSRDLIKLFYTRVKYANIFFTSYKPGWQTDRGMIYIVYGQPDYLYKSVNEERWIYNPRDLGTGIIFNFENITHSFSTNHFELNRAKQKNTGWDDAVKLWNSGEVYYYQPY